MFCSFVLTCVWYWPFVLAGCDIGLSITMLHSKLDQVDNEPFVDGGFVANTPIMKAARFFDIHWFCMVLLLPDLTVYTIQEIQESNYHIPTYAVILDVGQNPDNIILAQCISPLNNVSSVSYGSNKLI